MTPKFCSQCGASVVAGASFCVDCGQPLGSAAAPPQKSAPPPPRKAPEAAPTTTSWAERWAPLLILVVVLFLGAGAVLYGRLTEVPPPPALPRSAASGSAPVAGEGSAAKLPAEHPPLSIPEEVRTSIRQMEEEAKNAPDDLEKWKQLGAVQYRAGQLEPEFLEAAEKTFRHLLAKDPENLETLRWLGNVAYDRQKPEEAIGFYNTYLAKKPEDREVRTDLGTMYLTRGETAKAVEIYAAVVKEHPDFFQAQFNLGVALRSQGDDAAALAALEKARTVAGDERSRSQVDQVLARLRGEPAGAAPAAAPVADGSKPPGAPVAQGGKPSAGGPMANPHGSGAPAAPVAVEATNFREAAEAVFRQNPIMGPKVQKVEWTDDTTARVVLREFPVDQMGEAMQALFRDRMKGRLREQKGRFEVTQATRFELVDEANGRVMDTISE